MSELYNGVTLGTCTNLYYVRRDEIEREALTSDKAKRFLSTVFSYRFPWPDEDGQNYIQEGTARDYDRTFQLNVPNLTFPHGPVIVPVLNAGDTYRVTLSIPCPASRDFNLTHFQELKHPIQIVSEMYDSTGKSYTVLACSYCGEQFIPKGNQVELIRDAIRQYAKYSYADSMKGWYEQVANRIYGLPSAAEHPLAG